MAKESWGKKRTCPKCDTRFYDLNKDPLLCPNCGHTFSLDSIMEVFKKSTKDTSSKKSTDEKNSSEIEGIEPEACLARCSLCNQAPKLHRKTFYNLAVNN